MRYNLLTPDGLEVGYITDSPEFHYELAEETPGFSRIKAFIEGSADYEMVVAGANDDEATEYAVTPPEESVPASDYLRVVRLANQLPKKVPIRVESDEQG